MGRPFRAAPERQLGFRQGNRSSEGAGGAKPHAPTGLSPQVTGGGQTGFLEEILNGSRRIPVIEVKILNINLI